MNLSINDDSQLVKDARTRAFNDAKDRAQQYADLSGTEARQGHLDLGGPGHHSADPGADAARADGRRREAAVPIEPGQQTVSFEVTVVWELG